MNPWISRHLWFVVERDGEQRIAHWSDVDDAAIADGWFPVVGLRARSYDEAVRLLGDDIR